MNNHLYKRVTPQQHSSFAKGVPRKGRTTHLAWKNEHLFAKRAIEKGEVCVVHLSKVV